MNMNDEEKMKIADAIKMNSSVTKVADDLDLSRPTVYKYMEAYDNGSRDLPENVLAYFDKMVSSSDSITVLHIKIKLKEEIMRLNAKSKIISERMESLMEKSAIVEKDLVNSQNNPDANPRDLILLKHELDRLNENRQQLNVQYEDTQQRISALSAELATYEKTNTISVIPTNNLNKIQSRCYIENGRCMVVHNARCDEDEKCTLHLYVKIDSEFVHLESYETGEGKSFFIIDDVLLSAPLYYEIIMYRSSGFDPEFDEEVFTASKDMTTGMCELKQRK